MSTAIDLVIAQINRTRDLNRRPFDRATSVATPHGRWGIVHFGIMVPNLPDPFRFFDAIVILGTARAPVFGKRSLAAGDPDDSAWILTGSAVIPNGFEQYSITHQCDLSDAGTPPSLAPATSNGSTADDIAADALISDDETNVCNPLSAGMSLNRRKRWRSQRTALTTAVYVGVRTCQVRGQA
jgi:hypothetical protein